MLVNSGITHQKQQVSKTDITQHDIAQVSVYCWEI